VLIHESAVRANNIRSLGALQTEYTHQ